MWLLGLAALALPPAYFSQSGGQMVEEATQAHVPGRPSTATTAVPAGSGTPPQAHSGQTYLAPLQALVNRVSAYQDAVPIESAGRRGVRPYAPMGPTGDAVKAAMGTVGSAYAALSNSLGLPGTRSPKRPGEEEPVKEGFSAWEQPNWWNKPPEWIDSLPWWLEGYLEAKARQGDLKKDGGGGK